MNARQNSRLNISPTETNGFLLIWATEFGFAAALIAKALTDNGFTVTLAKDLTHDAFVQGLRTFQRQADGADWEVVYYAGHGMELQGTNYLIPVDAKLQADRDVPDETVTLDRVLSAIEMRAVAEPFIPRRAVRHLEKGRVVIFAAGTGNPYFTTDTAAALRAMEIKAEVIMKGTKVDGIYTADPMLDPTATKYDTITHLQVLERRLRVMDTTAISLCMDNKLPIVVFNLRQPGNLKRAVMGEPIGTTVS